MKDSLFLKIFVSAFLTTLFYQNNSFSQCSFTGLDPVYCVTDPASTLVGDPVGGSFSGPGITGTTFTPSGAGVGIHTITYEIPGGGTGDKYYIKSNLGDPWGSTTNQAAMNLAFGPGSWTLESFETADVASVFSASTGLVFMDGSDGQATELNTFLIANLPAIEAWVDAGGRLLLNSAPNEGGSMDFGFAGSTLVYGGTYANDVTVVDPAHPAILGPNLPTSVTMSGTYYSHAHVTGVGYTTVITETGFPDRIILFEKPWGAGRVMMGGMTTTNWHSPAPHAANWRANLLVYLYGDLGEPCIYTQDVEVIESPEVTLTVTPDDICIGESVVFTGGGDADSYEWSNPDIVDGVPYIPLDLGVFTVELTGTGGACANTVSVDVNVHDIPDASASADPDGYCLGQTVIFTNSTTIDDGASITWAWDFGDGGTSTAMSPSHIYPAIGTYTVTLTATSEFGCSDEFTFEVTIHPLPVTNFQFSVAGFSSADGATGGCVSNPVIFDNLSTIIAPDIIADVYWNFGDGSSSTDFEPSHTYAAPGTYSVTLIVTSNYGCTTTITKTIVMIEGLTMSYIISNPTCYGFSDGSIIVNVDEFTGVVIYSITDAEGDVLNIDNSNAANTLGEGWYYINVSDDSECTGEDSIYISEPAQLDIDLTVSNVVCYGDNTGWARVDSVYNATGLYSMVSFNWDPLGVGGIGVDSVANLSEGSYIVTVNDQNGCSRSFDFSVTEPDSLYFVELGYNPAYCRVYGYQSGNGVVYAGAAGGNPDYNYVWTNLETGATTTNTTWGGLNPGTYEITATDENGCIITSTIELDSLNPIADFEMTSPEFTSNYEGTAPMDVHFVNLSQNYSNPFNPSGEANFMWSFEFDATPWIITNDVDETYDITYEQRGSSYDVNVCLVAINKNGCADTICKIINIYEPLAFEPINIFTPNGDGLNDVFTFYFHANSISEFHCVIVNRWGKRVAELNDISESWDGTDKGGDLCPDGVYFYTYEAVTDNGANLVGQGTAQLISGK